MFLCFRVDSIMLVEEGFNMVSVDASDKMLKYALKARWDRRKESAFDQWGTKVLILIYCRVQPFLLLSLCLQTPSSSLLYRHQSLKKPTGWRCRKTSTNQQTATMLSSASATHLLIYQTSKVWCVLSWKESCMEMWESSNWMYACGWELFCWLILVDDFQGTKATRSWLFITLPAWWDQGASSSSTIVTTTTFWRRDGHHKEKTSTIRYGRSKFILCLF